MDESENAGLEAESESESESEAGDGSQSRRDMLRKAAVGATTAGIVWSMPKIEGGSLVPDAAGAATYSPSPFNGNLSWAVSNAPNGTCVTGMSQMDFYLGDHCSNTGNYVGMVGPFNADFTVHDHLLGSSPFNVDIAFNNIAPPFQMCTVNGADWTATSGPGGPICDFITTTPVPTTWTSPGSMTIAIDPNSTGVGCTDFPNAATINIHVTCTST